MMESFANGVYDIAWKKDNQNNDMKPTSVEIPEWVTSSLYDSNGYITTPLCVYFTKGTHTISMNSQREPMLIHKLYLKNSEEVTGCLSGKCEGASEQYDWRRELVGCRTVDGLDHFRP